MYLFHPSFYSMYLQNRRITMINYFSSAISSQILNLLHQLLQSLTPDQRSRFIVLQTQRFKKQIEILSENEAVDILNKLLEKEKMTVCKKNWKVEEINYLIFIIDKYCYRNQREIDDLSSLDWEQISKYLPQRSGSACLFRFLALSPSNITTVPWSNYEKNLLVRIIQNQNSKNINWRIISQLFYEQSKERIFRTGKQCREHYTCFLKPNLKKGPWTDNQDYQLINLFLMYGKKWSKMTQFIEGRNQNAIKNRFFLMFENKKKGKLSMSDLLKLVKHRKQKIEKKILHRQPTRDTNVVINDFGALTASQQQQSSMESQMINNENRVIENPNRGSSIFLNESIHSFNGEEEFRARMDKENRSFIHFNEDEFEKYINL